MLTKFIESVKQQIGYWQHQVEYFGPDHPRYNPSRVTKYKYLIQDFSGLLEYLEQQAENEAADNAVTRRPYAFLAPSTKLADVGAEPQKETPENIPDDLADLPRELLAELSEGIKGETDQLIKIINDRGGTATLDEVLIDLWRKHKEIGKRPIISNKLYRLSKRGLCWAVPGKKGIYTTTKPSSGGATPSTEVDEGSGTDTSEPSPAETAQQTQDRAPETGRLARAGLIRRRSLFASTAIPPTPSDFIPK
jgi:hypothetical protein